MCLVKKFYRNVSLEMQALQDVIVDVPIQNVVLGTPSRVVHSQCADFWRKQEAVSDHTGRVRVTAIPELTVMI